MSSTNLRPITLTIRESHVKTRKCTVCYEERPLREYSWRTPTDICEHSIKTCEPCLRKWISVGLDHNYQPEGAIKCPDCDEYLLGHNVNAQANIQDRERHWRINQRILRNAIPGWRWCLDPRCNSGQVHLPSATATLEKPDIFTCKLCNARACVRCDRPWHNGITCVEYAQSHIGQLVEDAVTSRVVAALKSQGKIKYCPNCVCPIEKTGMSGTLTCSRCKYCFDWDTI